MSGPRLLVASLMMTASLALSAHGAAPSDLVDAARGCLSASPDVADAGVGELRAAGPIGLNAFLAAHADVLARCGAAADGLPGVPTADGSCTRLLQVLDRVAGQRGALRSRLFWYTDLQAAKAAARESGRPILSLRLLGRLDEDFSCANSRFFRAVLYSDEAIARVLRDRFVLHWQSERPAPRVTVDLGDGRRLERTLTGNSVHYVLAPDGRPVDALPGLYAPSAFLSGLADAEAMALAYARTPEPRRDAWLRDAHRDAQARLEMRRAAEVKTLGLSLAPSRISEASLDAVARADRLAISKAAGQTTLLAGMAARARRPAGDEAWRAIGLHHLGEARLSDAARELVAREAPDAAGAIRRLEERIAEDTARNELDLHARLHGWFAAGTAAADLTSLDRRVYRELFLSADPDDPWAGLSPDDLFVALPDGGRVVRR